MVAKFWTAETTSSWVLSGKGYTQIRPEYSSRITRALSKPVEEGISWKRSRWIRHSGRDANRLAALRDIFLFAVARTHASQLIVSWPLIRTPYVSDINRSRASWPM